MRLRTRRGVALNSIEAILKTTSKRLQIELFTQLQDRTDQKKARVFPLVSSVWLIIAVMAVAVLASALPEVSFLISALLFFALGLFTRLEITVPVCLPCLGDIPEKEDAIKLSLAPISAPESLGLPLQQLN